MASGYNQIRKTCESHREISRQETIAKQKNQEEFRRITIENCVATCGNLVVLRVLKLNTTRVLETWPCVKRNEATFTRDIMCKS
jgi:hypothetical protein